VLSLGISIDGCPAIHDKNRIFAERGPEGEEIGSMGEIIKWWPWLQEINPSYCEVTKATCSRESIPYLFESLQFMHEELGITYINQNFIMEPNGCTEEDYLLLEEQLNKCIEYVFNHQKEVFWSMIDERFIHRLSDANNESLDTSWCGSGAMPALGINGKIYPCFRWLPHTQEDQDKSEEFCVGDIWNGITRKENFRRIREATRRVISPPECLICEYEPCCSYCYTPDTPVLMPDFSTKPISRVEAGDEIIAFDEYPAGHGTKRKYQIAKVEKTFLREVDEDLYYIDKSEHGTTGEHPVLIEDGNDALYVPVKAITGKNKIFRHDCTMSEIKPSKRAEIDIKHYKGFVHNLKTSTRTYIADGVLVHNCIGGCYSEYGCLKRTTHICEITKLQAKAAEKYWKRFDEANGTNHFLNRPA
jgi:radical SAM protein with 4Fe4S-binding SPASM domain